MKLDNIVSISHKYGLNEEFVLAGGGNTSYKDNENLYIKGSGTSLATITSKGFVKMSRERLSEIWNKTYSEDSNEREAEVLKDMMIARCDRDNAKRPSVETLLHNLFVQTYVLHVHPAKVNGLTCSIDGEEAMEKMFSDAIWIEETEPGYILASKCRKKIEEFYEKTGKRANLLFLQNHGVFFASDSVDELDTLVDFVMQKFTEKEKIVPDFTKTTKKGDTVSEISSIIGSLYDAKTFAYVEFTLNKEIEKLCESRESFYIMQRPMTPDHIVYCKSSPLFLNDVSKSSIEKQFLDFTLKYKYFPRIVFVKEVGMFAVGTCKKDAGIATKLWLDAIKIAVYAQNFGGVRHMSDEIVKFIENWEVENYRSKVSLSNL